MKFSNIIAAINIDDDLSEGVLAYAQGMADRDGAALTVLTVWPHLSTTSPGFAAEYSGAGAVVSEAAIERHRQAREECEERLKAFTNQRAPNAQIAVLEGDAAEKTVAYAKEKGADLIVCGSHQRGFWGRLWEGGASRDLAHTAPCAVLLATAPSIQAMADKKSA